jgi:hypothetical protein
MKSLSFSFIMLASLFAIAGMGFGIYMAISQDHSMAPAHAHNNLIGFVTMALYGIYYALVPAAAATRLAAIHFWIALLGALTFGPGLILVFTGQGEWLVQIASIASIIAMVIFAYTVFANRAALARS